MARPRTKELTERELEVMHTFWANAPSDANGDPEGGVTASEIRDALAAGGRELAYTTVATLIRLLTDKGFLEQTKKERPFRYRPIRTFEEVSGSLLGDLIERVFGGSREQLLLRLMDHRRLSKRERQLLESILRERS